MAKRHEIGSLEGRQRYINELVAAAKQIQAEEKMGRSLDPQDVLQLNLFDKLKTEDAKHGAN